MKIQVKEPKEVPLKYIKQGEVFRTGEFEEVYYMMVCSTSTMVYGDIRCVSLQDGSVYIKNHDTLVQRVSCTLVVE